MLAERYLHAGMVNNCTSVDNYLTKICIYEKTIEYFDVTTPEAYLSKDGLNVVISVQQEEVFRIPVINIEGIVTFGYMGASPGVMKLCSDNGISLTFLSPQGRFISRVQGATKGNVLLRKSSTNCRTMHLGRCMWLG